MKPSSTILLLLTIASLVSCAKVDVSSQGSRVQLSEQPRSSLTTVNPPAATQDAIGSASGAHGQSTAPSKGLFNPDMGYMEPKHFTEHDRWDYPYFSVTRKTYQNAIRNRDSGYAHDAFIASMAYRSGYYKAGKSFSKGKGKDMEKSLHYLHLASDLGHPEASFLLFQCHRDGFAHASMWQDVWARTPSIPVGNIRHDRYEGQRCLHSYEDWQIYDVTDDIDEFVLGSDNNKAKMYLERTALQGRDFNANFQYRPGSLADIDTLQARINMLITHYQSMELKRRANELFKTNGQREPFIGGTAHTEVYTVTFKDCGRILDSLATNAKFEEKLSCANNSDRRFCPGMGYNQLRDTTDACRILSPSQAGYDHYFYARVGLYHPYFDRFSYEGAYHFLSDALKLYERTGNTEKANEVSALITYVQNDTANFSSDWESVRNKAAQQRIAQRAEEERQKQARLEQARKEREDYERWSEQIDREVEQAWANKPIGSGAFNAMDDIQQIQDQTMNNLNMILDQQQGAATRSTPAYSTTPSKPMEYQIKQAKDQPEQCNYPKFGTFCSDEDDSEHCKADRERIKQQYERMPEHCKGGSKNSTKFGSNPPKPVTRGK